MGSKDLPADAPKARSAQRAEGALRAMRRRRAPRNGPGPGRSPGLVCFSALFDGCSGWGAAVAFGSPAVAAGTLAIIGGAAQKLVIATTT